jgi:RNA polymerase sigma-70 factor (ECF subfamily)
MVDAAVFEAAYAAHGAGVLRYATYSAGSRQAAEDIAAEAWARYIERGARVPAERVEAWMIRVTRNLCASHHRAAVRGRQLEARIAESADGPMEADGWTQPEVWQHVRALSEPERLAIYLRIVEERSFPDVARVLGKSEGAAKMTFYRALRRLRAQLETATAPEVPAAVGGAENV